MESKRISRTQFQSISPKNTDSLPQIKSIRQKNTSLDRLQIDYFGNIKMKKSRNQSGLKLPQTIVNMVQPLKIGVQTPIFESHMNIYKIPVKN